MASGKAFGWVGKISGFNYILFLFMFIVSYDNKNGDSWCNIYIII
jgi:hypothetical protein